MDIVPKGIFIFLPGARTGLTARLTAKPWAEGRYARGPFFSPTYAGDVPLCHGGALRHQSTGLAARRTLKPWAEDRRACGILAKGLSLL